MYIIQEIQTTDGVSALLPAVTQSDRNDAESAFYSKVAYAAASSVQVHTVIMYDEHGNVLLSKYYEHTQELQTNS